MTRLSLSYLIPRLNQPKSSFCTQVGSFDHIRFPSSHRIVLEEQQNYMLVHVETECGIHKEERHTLVAPTTKLWATLEMKPSTCTPRSLCKNRMQYWGNVL